MDIKSYFKSNLRAIKKRSQDRSHQKAIAKELAISRGINSKFRLKPVVYVAAFGVLVGLAGVNYLPDWLASGSSVEAGNSSTLANVEAVSVDQPAVALGTVDKVAASTLAANLATVANLPVASQVANLSISTTIEAEAIQKVDPVVAKPEILSLNSTRQDVKLYLTQDGDTLDSIAKAHDVTVQTIKWANKLTADAVEPGKELKILPVDGVYYQVKASDTLDSLVDRYKTNAGRVVAINNLEVSGLVAGQMIILPNADLPETERPGYMAPRPVVASAPMMSFSSARAGNRYSYGWCTWYAYDRYADLNGGKTIGSFWGNANTWDNAARQDPSFSVTNTPTVGAIFQTDAGWAGHVGVVEAVLEDGSIRVSDMNGPNGWGRVSYQTWSAERAAAYVYIK